jgi:hypothetical protein
MLTVEQHHWLLDNLGAPDSPLHWFAQMKRPPGPVGWLFDLAKWLVLIVWSVAFIWVWFTVFAVLFLWEGLGFLEAAGESESGASASPPAESQPHD